ncbi:MAG: pentapeptide repeat-containing protein [Leptolyngbyaceae cyanobacterium]
MQHAPSHSFINQDLRRRSFRGQNLQNANFYQCQLQGCDFTQANLRGAKFRACGTGLSRRWILLLPIVLLLTGLLFHAVSSLLFAALGTVPGQSAWLYVQVLIVILQVGALSTALLPLAWPVTSLAKRIMGATAAALMGLFYVGSLTDNNPLFALAGAIALGLLSWAIAGKMQPAWLDAVLGAMGGVIAYSYAFWTWTGGSNLLAVRQWLTAGLALTLAVIFVVVALNSLVYCGQSLKRFASTSFCRADLTHCTFIETDVTHCDVAGAIR